MKPCAPGRWKNDAPDAEALCEAVTGQVRVYQPQQRIGERLTRAMAKAHMNRSELAELTGYSVEQIVSWERGRARMYPIELIKLCHALDVKPEWLLCWERRVH